MAIRFAKLAAALAVGLGIAALSAVPAAADPVVLKFATITPPGNPINSKILEPWAQMVSDLGGSDLQIKAITGFTLANPGNSLDRTMDGVVDLAVVLSGASGHQLARTMVTNLPGQVDRIVPASLALTRMEAKGVLGDEWKGVKVIALTPMPGSMITTAKLVTKVEDLRGLKLRSADKVTSEIATTLGAAPVVIPPAEIYQSLERGVVGGVIGNSFTIGSFKLYEVARHHVVGPALGLYPAIIVMNKQSYEKLPPKAKAVIDRISGDYSARYLGNLMEQLDTENMKDLAARSDQQIYTVPPSEIPAWNAALKPVVDSWKARTPDADKVLAALHAEYQAALAEK